MSLASSILYMLISQNTDRISTSAYDAKACTARLTRQRTVFFFLRVLLAFQSIFM